MLSPNRRHCPGHQVFLTDTARGLETGAPPLGVLVSKFHGESSRPISTRNFGTQIDPNDHVEFLVSGTDTYMGSEHEAQTPPLLSQFVPDQQLLLTGSPKVWNAEHSISPADLSQVDRDFYGTDLPSYLASDGLNETPSSKTLSVDGKSPSGSTIEKPPTKKPGPEDLEPPQGVVAGSVSQLPNPPPQPATCASSSASPTDKYAEIPAHQQAAPSVPLVGPVKQHWTLPPRVSASRPNARSPSGLGSVPRLPSE